MRFINREATNPNRKTLNVIDVTYNDNTGEVSSLIVDEANNDGPVTVGGIIDPIVDVTEMVLYFTPKAQSAIRKNSSYYLKNPSCFNKKSLIY